MATSTEEPPSMPSGSSAGSSQSATKSLSLRAQKKLFGSMTNKNVTKLFMDEKSAHLLDTIHHLTRDYLGNKRRADKLLSYTVKTAIKVAVLIRNNQLTSIELGLCEEFRRKLHLAAVTLISFYEVDFSFDKAYLSGILRKCGELLKTVVKDHLTGKSLNRITEVFGFYASEEWLEWIFTNADHKANLKSMVEDLHQLLKDGQL